MIGNRRHVVALLVLVALVALVASGCAGSAAPASSSFASPSPSTAPTATASVPPAAVSEDLDGAADPSVRPPVATPSLAASEAPMVTPPPATPTPSAAPAAPAEPFAINLYRDGDHVRQYTFEWCVGASIQMTLNMVRPENDTSRANQRRVWEMARDRSFSPFGGANPVGWVATLNELDVGRYELVSVPTYDEALRVAARALAETERPVGLVMWRGRHAWMMSGFEANADPLAADAFDVTGIRVLDPLYPHGSKVWGPSPEPNSLLTPAVLGKQFVIRDRGRVNLGVPPGYLLVLPTEA